MENDIPGSKFNVPCFVLQGLLIHISNNPVLTHHCWRGSLNRAAVVHRARPESSGLGSINPSFLGLSEFLRVNYSKFPLISISVFEFYGFFISLQSEFQNNPTGLGGSGI